MESTVLCGWKEIAHHIGRGVRTIQRWESYGLPVHRVSGKSSGSVIAVAAELDAWLKGSRTHEDDRVQLLLRIADLEAEVGRLKSTQKRQRVPA